MWISVASIIVAIAFIFGGAWLVQLPQPVAQASDLPTFSTCTELSAAISEAQEINGYSGDDGLELGLGSTRSLLNPSVQTFADSEPGGASEYSTTNVQVEGVDEADYVKTDGDYIYTLSGNDLVIARAYPVSDAGVVSRVDMTDISPSQMFLDDDRLLVLGGRFVESGVSAEEVGPGLDFEAMLRSAFDESYVTVAELWNVRSKENPVRIRATEIEGDLIAARMIDGEAYIVTSKSVWDVEDDAPVVPMMRDVVAKNAAVGEAAFAEALPCDQITHFDPVVETNFITVASIPLNDDNGEIERSVTLGSGENVYASTEHLFVAETSYVQTVGDVIEYRSWWWGDASAQTVVHKFALNNGKVEYKGNGTVPGTVLNQFSMDEHNNHFRIATTIGSVSRSGTSMSTNNVYVLNSAMERVGAVEDLAPGETIYSVRFMGDKGYVVTFKKVDPLFVLDLSKPTEPEVLGKLKIPGYSDYLHPYDENHIIGIGKDTTEAEGGNFAWYQGLKLAVFDVTDPTNPVQMHQEIIGDRGTESPVLDDHKALLFDRERELFVIPVTLAEIDEALKDSQAFSWNSPANGSYTFQGALVYHLTLDSGFELRDRITHVADQEEFLKLGSFYPSYDDVISRSLYIEDGLYTLSESTLKINALDDLEELKTISLTAQ